LGSVAKEVLKKYWNYDSFRPLQEDIIEHVLKENSTLALLPTGAGKSLCYQIPGIILGGVTVVISPLVALMKDQVQHLKKRGIKAEQLHAGSSFKEMAVILDSVSRKEIQFLYVSPERLKNSEFLRRAQLWDIKLVAVDEAHCISKWGHDFRPAYQEINNFLKLVSNPKIIALTATATAKVIQDILLALEIPKAKVFSTSFARKNLSFIVSSSNHKSESIRQCIEKTDGSVIVYARTRKACVEIAAYLNSMQINALFYHAGLSAEDREKRQEAWINDQAKVMVATNAFGMGIDKPNVRLVLHSHLCDNLEAYYQEAGRAGRDADAARAICFIDSADAYYIRNSLLLKYPELETLSKVYASLASYLQVALGSEMTDFKVFDYQNFAITFGLNPLHAHYALQSLSTLGLIEWLDAGNIHSKLQLKVSNASLQSFLLKSPQFEALIITLLRIYGGELFSHFVNISETEVLSHVQLSNADFKKYMVYLERAQILSYIPSTSSSQIKLTGSRIEINKHTVDLKLLQVRKEADYKSAEAIIQYAENQNDCRMAIIQSYFGEENPDDCGICDNCQRSIKQNLSREMLKDAKVALRHLVPATFSKILSSEFFLSKSESQDILKYLFETEFLVLDSTGLILIK
jgi:ATP-dependent DNA helicase RecQ